jgi:hypothetical protein
MGIYRVNPLLSCCDERKKGNKNPFAKEKFLDDKTTDDRIQEVAIEKISTRHVGVICGKLVATTTAPAFFMRFFTDLFTKKRNKDVGLSSTPSDDRLMPKYGCSDTDETRVPIGIAGVKNNSWINALMQYIIFVPSLRSLFDFAPRSLVSFSNFLDKYHCDQQKNKAVTLAESSSLLLCLMKNFPKFFSYYCNGDIDLYGVLSLLSHSIQSSNTKMLYKQKNKSNSAEWHIVCRKRRCDCLSLDQHIADSIRKLQKKDSNNNGAFYFPLELVVAFKKCGGRKYDDQEFISHPAFQAKTQYFFSDKGLFSVCYNLEAFIEQRPDSGNSCFYVTYVKINGSWYQCDDERVKQIRSHNLNGPITRGVLFYYKRIRIGEYSADSLV